MLGLYKCAACGKQFRPKRWQRHDICTDCDNAPIEKRAISTSPTAKSESELDVIEDMVRQAQYQQASERVNGVSSMNESVVKWQQLNRILNGPAGSLSSSERNKYEKMRDNLEKSNAIKAFLRESKRRTRQDRMKD